MTLNEIKREVCGKLNLYATDGVYFQFLGGTIYWERDGLQICHEVEKLLDSKEKCRYAFSLKNCYTEDLQDMNELFTVLNTTHEQRIQALARVWWLERLKV